MKSFANWYDGAHLHSAIRFVTPDERHAGRDRATLADPVPVSIPMHAHKTRDAGQAKPATGNRLGPSGSTPTTKPASLKSETPDEIGGLLL